MPTQPPLLGAEPHPPRLFHSEIRSILYIFIFVADHSQRPEHLKQLVIRETAGRAI
jgi:hypothetical protein